MKHFPKIVLALCVAALCAFVFTTAGCKVSGTSGVSVVASIEAVDVNGPVLFARYDLDTILVVGSVHGEAYVFDKVSGATLLGPIVFDPTRSIYLASRSRDFKGSFARSDPLPHWLLDTRIISLQQANTLGLVIAPE